MRVVSTFFFCLFINLFSTLAMATDLIRIHGSNTVGATLMPSITRAWLSDRGYKVTFDDFLQENERLIRGEKDGKRLNIEIHAHGSSTAFKDLLANTADIGMASRPAKAKEQNKFAAYGDITQGGREIVLGLDGIAVVVHPHNGIASLSMAQLKAVFSGEVRNWAQLGGPNRPIQVYARDNKSGTYDTFKSLVLGKKNPLVAGAKRYESNDKLSDDVARDPGGIGFTGLPSIRQAKALAVSDGANPAVLPSEFSVATEDYPLSRRLYLYAPFELSVLQHDLLQYAQANVGQTVVGQVGFVAQHIEPYQVTLGQHYPQEYRQMLDGANRLSLNFRFRPGQYKLDNKALQDVDRLVNYLVANPASEVILTGFSDGAEASIWRSRILSMERGDYVASQLIRKGVVPKVVRGFGSEVQVASNDSAKGRDKNRRVEVWVR